MLQLGFDQLQAADVGEPTVALCSTLQEFMDLLTDFVVKNLQHLRCHCHSYLLWMELGLCTYYLWPLPIRKQAEAHEKMIERKDELIQRFNHHRQENLKKERATKFRECSIRPLI